MKDVMEGRTCRYCRHPITMPCQRPDCTREQRHHPGQRHSFSKLHPLTDQEIRADERERRIGEVGGRLYRERSGRGLCVCCGQTECDITGEVSE
jgi:hypothetical protein